MTAKAVRKDLTPLTRTRTWFIKPQLGGSVEHLNVGGVQPVKEHAICTVVVGRAQDATQVPAKTRVGWGQHQLILGSGLG